MVDLCVDAPLPTSSINLSMNASNSSAIMNWFDIDDNDDGDGLVYDRSMMGSNGIQLNVAITEACPHINYKLALHADLHGSGRYD